MSARMRSRCSAAQNAGYALGLASTRSSLCAGVVVLVNPVARTS
jgi:hypothetical protein